MEFLSHLFQYKENIMHKDELIFGKTYHPSKSKTVVEDDRVTGPDWKVFREGKKYLFEFLAARHGGGTDSHVITEDEFKATKTGEMTFQDLLRKYDR